tara:strand:+ start:255 stop:488 length:234 start_codon:yes stop_codon:yes gene_type:complete
MISFDGFDDALLGVCEVHTLKPRLIYDWEKCVKVLIDRDEMTYEEAIEWMDFNVTCLWAGESTPAFLHTNELGDERT